jgi:P27 family predicted phage terminase small subunit
MRGRKPKPEAQRRLEGNPGHRRLPPADPLPAPEPQAFEAVPEELADDPRAAAEWRRVVPLLTKVRLVTDADRASLIAVCLEWSRYLEASRKVAQLGMVVKTPSGYPMPNPYLAIQTKALSGCTKLWPELGLTPSSRTRVAPAAPGATPGARDAFSEFDDPLPDGPLH